MFCGKSSGYTDGRWHLQNIISHMHLKRFLDLTLLHTSAIIFELVILKTSAKCLMNGKGPSLCHLSIVTFPGLWERFSGITVILRVCVIFLPVSSLSPRILSIHVVLLSWLLKPFRWQAGRCYAFNEHAITFRQGSGMVNRQELQSYYLEVKPGSSSISCVTLRKTHDLFGPQFPRL